MWSHSSLPVDVHPSLVIHYSFPRAFLARSIAEQRRRSRYLPLHHRPRAGVALALRDERPEDPFVEHVP